MSANKLLKGKGVFIDTTEFSNARFDMSNPAFVKFAELCKAGKFRLFTTDITQKEIEDGIQIQMRLLHERLAETVKLAGGITTQETAALKKFGESFDVASQVVAMRKRVEDFFVDCQTVALAIPANATDYVVGNFVRRKPPFDKRSKKSEFPDAFVLHAIADTARRRSGSFYVISNDDDFKRMCSEYDYLEHMNSLSQLLNQEQVASAFTAKINRTIDKNLDLIRQELGKILKHTRVASPLPGVSVLESKIRITDILDTLIISCDGNNAAVDFACEVEVSAVLDIFREPEFSGVDSQTETQTTNITLEFDFDPRNPDHLKITSIWSPTALNLFVAN